MAEGKPIPVPALALVVLGRHQESERHFESIVHFVSVQPKRKAWSHARENGDNAMAPRCHVDVEIAYRLNKATRKCDLLFGLAQRGRSWAFVSGIDLAAGKRNLPGMVSKMSRALSEEHAQLVAFDDRHQDCGRPDRPHCSDGADHRGIGIVLVVPRDNVRVGEPYRYIERKPLLYTGKQFRSGE